MQLPYKASGNAESQVTASLRKVSESTGRDLEPIGVRVMRGSSDPRSRNGALEVGALHATRDFVDVRDVADMLFFLSEHGEPGETYNVASGRECPIEFLLSQMLELWGERVQIVRREGELAGVLRQVADMRRLAIPARIPLRQSVRDLLDYYRRLAAPAPAQDPRCPP
jgi:hypothetical protein